MLNKTQNLFINVFKNFNKFLLKSPLSFLLKFAFFFLILFFISNSYANEIINGNLKTLIIENKEHNHIDNENNQEIFSNYETVNLLETKDKLINLNLQQDLAKEYYKNNVAVKVNNNDNNDNNDNDLAASNPHDQLLGVINNSDINNDLSASLGNKKLAVVLVNFNNDNSTPYSKNDIQNTVLDSNTGSVNYYKELSNNQINFVGNNYTNGDTFGWYNLPNVSGTECYNDRLPSNGIRADVDFIYHIVDEIKEQNYIKSDSENNINLDDYDNVAFVFPNIPNCPWGGIAETPGKYSFMNGYIITKIFAHELGHNLGVHHASSQICTENAVNVFISNNCQINEYGDHFDIMGSISTRLQNNFHMYQLGIFNNTNLNTITSSGNYSINATMFGTNTIVRIPRVQESEVVNSSTEYYYLELRKPFGTFDNFADNSSLTRGLSIRLARNLNIISQTKLLNARPIYDIEFGSLRPGNTVTDQEHDIAITVNSVDGYNVNFSIDYHSITDLTPPSKPANISINKNNNQVNLSWSHSTDENPINYSIKRNNVLIANNLSNNSYIDNINDFTQDYYYQVIVYDENGNSIESDLALLEAEVPEDDPETPEEPKDEPEAPENTPKEPEAPENTPQDNTEEDNYIDEVIEEVIEDFEEEIEEDNKKPISNIKKELSALKTLITVKKNYQLKLNFPVKVKTNIKLNNKTVYNKTTKNINYSVKKSKLIKKVNILKINIKLANSSINKTIKLKKK